MDAFEDEAASDRLCDHGNILVGEKKWAEALGYYQRALAARERHLGRTADKTMFALVDTADCLDNLGKHNEALPLYERVLKECPLHLREEKLMLRLKSSYAGSLRGVGRFQDAIVLYKEVEKLQGDPNARCSVLTGLAGTYRDIGNYSEAMRYYHDVYDTSVKLKGEEHIETLSSINNMALLLLSSNQAPETACKLLQRVYDGYVKNMGVQHPNTIKTATSLAQTLCLLGRHEEAAQRLRDLLRVAESLYGEFNQPSLSIANSLGNALNDCEKFDEAEEVLENCLEGLVLTYGEGHHMTLTTRANWAKSMRGTGRVAEALQELDKVRAGLASMFGANFATVRIIDQERVRVLAELGRFRNAADIQRNMVAHYSQERPSSFGTMKCLQDLVLLLRASGEVVEAEQYSLQVEKIRNVLGKEYDSKPSDLEAIISKASKELPSNG